MDYRALYGETADEREPLERYRSIGGGSVSYTHLTLPTNSYV